MADSLNIVFPIYPGVTHLDFTGPHQVLARLPGTRITVASAGGQPVAADGFNFNGLARLEDVDHCDVLCVPGGHGCIAVLQDPVYMAAIRRLATSARYVTSVCTGSLILGAAGLLVGKRAACHWAWRDLLAPLGAIPDPARVVRDGNILTGGGVTAGIDFAFTLAAEIAGEEAAQTLQLGLEYAPAPPFNSGSPDSAPRAVLERVQALNAPQQAARRAAIDQAARALG
ncbi:MAG TPA: DJ-1/PfpI family protein [Burkholderiaceae bacterium]|nr:DJ-1/PfpI family protein [Burkholderiaceae bacterium]